MRRSCPSSRRCDSALASPVPRAYSRRARTGHGWLKRPAAARQIGGTDVKIVPLLVGPHLERAPATRLAEHITTAIRRAVSARQQQRCDCNCVSAALVTRQIEPWRHLRVGHQPRVCRRAGETGRSRRICERCARRLRLRRPRLGARARDRQRRCHRALRERPPNAAARPADGEPESVPQGRVAGRNVRAVVRRGRDARRSCASPALRHTAPERRRHRNLARPTARGPEHGGHLRPPCRRGARLACVSSDMAEQSVITPAPRNRGWCDQWPGAGRRDRPRCGRVHALADTAAPSAAGATVGL
eukprot:SAG11_NODE_1401_length_5015_cov_14.634662_3_plen_302_part_00